MAEFNDSEMLAQPERWPWFPYLPLKTDDFKVGTLVYWSEQKKYGWDADHNLFDTSHIPNFKEVEPSTLLKEGWYVD